MADPQTCGGSRSERVLQELQFFVSAGNALGVESLLESLGADERHRVLNVPDEITGELPSHSAAKYGNIDVLEAVLPEYEDVNAKSTNSGRSAIHFAAGHGHSRAVQWLFACRMADLNVCDNKGNTPLHLAVLLGHKDVVRFLVTEGVSLSALNRDGMMPVSYCKDQEMFQALLSSHASSVNARRAVTSPSHLHGPEKKGPVDADGRTILHYAAQYSTNHEVIAMLIFDAERRDSEGHSFLDVAAKAGNMAVLEAVKKLGPARIDYKSLLIRGRDELHSPGLYALLHNRREFFDELVSMGKVQITLGCIVKVLIAGLIGDSNIQGRVHLFASTLPTYLALYANKDLVFQFLLEKTQLTVNQWDDVHKRTCLHWAVVDKRKDIVEKLCKNVQLRPSIQDGDGKTALHHAFEQKHYEILEILRGRSDFKDHEEKLYRDRDVYVQALNAILVGAALIASVTFAGWLQLPGDVFKSLGLKVFWASNSLSFSSAVATMCVTTAALIPTPTRYVGDIVHQLRLAIVLDASLLALSLAAVMVAFAAAGFAALRHSHVSDYQASMRGTTAVGGFLCTAMWIGFVLKLYKCMPSFNGILLARAGESSRIGYPNVLQEDIRNAMSGDLVGYPARTSVRQRTSTPDLPTMRRLLSKLQIPGKESFIQGLDPEKQKNLLRSKTLKEEAMSLTIGEFDLPSAM